MGLMALYIDKIKLFSNPWKEVKAMIKIKLAEFERTTRVVVYSQIVD